MKRVLCNPRVERVGNPNSLSQSQNFAEAGGGQGNERCDVASNKRGNHRLRSMDLDPVQGSDSCARRLSIAGKIPGEFI